MQVTLHLQTLGLQAAVCLQIELWVGAQRNKRPWTANLFHSKWHKWHQLGEWTLGDTTGAQDRGGRVRLVNAWMVRGKSSRGSFIGGHSLEDPAQAVSVLLHCE